MLAQLLPRNPVAWILVIQTPGYLTAQFGVALVTQMHEVGGQMILFFLRHFSQFAFNFLQAHAGTIAQSG